MYQLEMSVIDCQICGMKNAQLIRSEEELIDFRCMECKSTFMNIYNYDLYENQIEHLKGQNI